MRWRKKRESPNAYVQKCWRPHELPDGRKPESFRFHIRFFYGPDCVDEFLTDDLLEHARIVADGLEQGYEVKSDDGRSCCG